VLLKEAIGLLRPTAGSVRLLDTDVWNIDQEQLNVLRRRFGMLFQDGALFSSLTVAENIAVPFREHTDLPRELIPSLVGFKLALVGLPPETGACESVSRWHARSPWNRKSCFLTNRPQGSTR
jgi:phospholipid/cholesterol/gamma-HCH transport system ATP-binding protein